MILAPLAAGGLTCPSLSNFLHGRAFLGDILALCGAIAGAAYLLIGRKLRAKMSLISYISLVYGMAAIVLVIIMLIRRRKSLRIFSSNLYMADPAGSHPTINRSFNVQLGIGISLSRLVSITLLGEPIGSTILAYFILHEKPSLIKLAGGVLILVGIYIASRSEADKTPELPD